MNQKKQGYSYLVFAPHVPKPFIFGEVQYYTVTKNDVCILEIPDAQVGNALSVMSGCCGAERRAFRYASEEEIQTWLN